MIVVAAVIIVFQMLSAFDTWKRMNVFSKIFGTKKNALSYELLKTDSAIVGFNGHGENADNPAFSEIKASINNYVENNESIDFQIIKETIDANCDSREEDVQAQIPIPLYLGLAGTMAGIIIGVGSLWLSGALKDLTAGAVTVLLGGVAIAMGCSIVGLLMTTYFTWRFKGCKLLIEQRKSTLLAWLQQHLLPEVATDDLQAMGHLAEQLRMFNTTFRRNTTIFGNTLESVRTTLEEQKQLALQVRSMGEQSERMAEKNASATYRLEQSSERLQQFNDYLDSINGYVNEVHSFTENFKEETLRLGVLEEIYNFFKEKRDEMEQRQNEMSRKIAEFDVPFRRAMTELRNSMVHETEELKRIVAEHTRDFENTLREQKSVFKSSNAEILKEFEAQNKQMPQAVTAINGLKGLPEQINGLMQRVEESNNTLIRELKRALPSVVITGGGNGGNGEKEEDDGGVPTPPVPPAVMPQWLKWTIATGVVVTALACAGMCAVTCYNTWGKQEERQTTENTETTAQAPTTIVTTPPASTAPMSSAKTH